MDTLLRLQHIKHTLLPTTAIFGAHALFSDTNAPLMEISAPGAAIHSATLCKQMVFVTPRLAIIKTDTTKEAWRTHVDDIMQEDTACVVLRIKHKTSWLGGRPGQVWVTPSATQNKLSAARRTKASAIDNPQPQHMVANISIGGAIGWDPQAVVAHLTQLVGQFSRIPPTGRLVETRHPPPLMELARSYRPNSTTGSHPITIGTLRTSTTHHQPHPWPLSTIWLRRSRY